MEIFEVRNVEERLDIMSKCEIEAHKAKELLDFHAKEKYLAFACNDLLNGFVFINESGDITHMTTLPFAKTLGLDEQMREYVQKNYKNK